MTEFIVDIETNVARVVTFQAARPIRLFAAFPEVGLVDSTYGTNVNQYKLFSFAVHDVFGRGQYVQHAIVQTEEMSNLKLAVAAFKKNNLDWSKIQGDMAVEAQHEKDVVHEAWQTRRYCCVAGTWKCGSTDSAHDWVGSASRKRRNLRNSRKGW
ncbi:hypothetical protein PC116_g20776 [Phytophthora cactorum]|nr:hypothetical protein PC111_g21430 [Phytophthora cactorum]KAG2838132.1 hypothetical protein PC113_g19713 [Phytophthora cactorum]KAG2979975.1 hypothetical protein PC118_g11466 [Phytophthora cactorum]KAG4230937.1 hypothetical protein PC116_g20776 [Phytophthora cactorum]